LFGFFFLGSVLQESDVLAIDRVSFKMIDELRKAERNKNVTPEQFNQLFADTKFIVIGSDAKTYPLIKGSCTFVPKN